MQEKIYNYLLTIPKGKVTTYKVIAKHLGNEKLARYVGNVLHRNPSENKYPCYKVVNSKGMLSNNYAFGGISKQREKLIKDGVIVINNRVNLKKYLYINCSKNEK